MPRLSDYSGNQILAVVLTVVLIGYISWKISESADQALQFAFNGASVGAIYALLAIGFTLVYSTVWFFDLYYGVAAAIGAYGVFYLRSKDALQVGQFEVNELYVNVVFALVVAGVAGWGFQAGLRQHIAARIGRRGGLVVLALTAAAAGSYSGFLLTNPDELNVVLSPVVGALTGIVAFWAANSVIGTRVPEGARMPFIVLAAIGSAALGAYCGLLTSQSSGSSLYLSWGRLLPAGRLGQPDPVPRPLSIHAPPSPVSIDNAGGIPRYIARSNCIHNHHLPVRPPPPPRGFWQHSMADLRRIHQTLQRLLHRCRHRWIYGADPLS